MPDEMIEYLHSLKSIDYNCETSLTEENVTDFKYIVKAMPKLNEKKTPTKILNIVDKILNFTLKERTQ